MLRSINNFRNNFQGTRPNRFRISIDLPTGAQIAKLDLYGKATQVPTASMGVIPVPWMGRVIKFSGERLFPDWTVQIYDAGGGDDTRAFFMQWLEKMNTAETHALNYNETGEATVRFDDFGSSQSAPGGQTGFTRSFTLKHIFPIDVGPLELSYDASDSFSEFTVTFAYDYLIYEGGAGGGGDTPRQPATAPPQ